MQVVTVVSNGVRTMFYDADAMLDADEGTLTVTESDGVSYSVFNLDFTQAYSVSYFTDEELKNP